MARWDRQQAAVARWDRQRAAVARWDRSGGGGALGWRRRIGGRGRGGSTAAVVRSDRRRTLHERVT